MQEGMEYKGYGIRATPDQNPDSGKWTFTLWIVESTGEAVRYSPFYARKEWQTKDESLQACFTYGKQIIDGEVKGHGVDDL